MRREREVGVRLSVKDGEVVERALRNLGQEGQAALRRIQRSARPANDALRLVNEGARAAHDGIARLGGVARAGLAGAIAGLTGSSLLAALRGSASGIAAIGDAARRAGLDIESFQELKFVAEQNRIGVDSLVDGIKELNLRADEFITTGSGPAAEAFARLGFSAEELREKLEDPSALFSEIIRRVEQLDRAAQIRIFDEIFGGAGGERFVELIARGADEIERQVDAAHDLGLVLDQEVIDKADELDRKFSAVASTVESALKQAIVGAASALDDFLRALDQARNRGPLSRQAAQLGPDALQAEIDRALEIINNPATNSVAKERSTAWLNALLAQQQQLATMDGIGGGASWRGMMGLLGPRAGAPTGGSSGSERETATTETERQAQKTRELIAALQDELSLIGASETERRVMTELRRAGVEAASAEGQTIRGLVQQIGAEEDALERLQDAMQNVGDVTRDVVGGMIADFRAGKTEAEILSNAFDRLLDKAVSGGIDLGINTLTGWLTQALSPAPRMGYYPGLTGPSLLPAAHSGWRVGRGNPPQTRSLASLPRLHMGGLSRDEQLAVLRRDETVFTPRQMDNAEGLIQALVRNAAQAPRQSGPSTIVELHNHTGQRVREEQATRSDGTEVRRFIVGEVSTAFADGSMDGLMDVLYGVKRRGH